MALDPVPEACLLEVIGQVGFATRVSRYALPAGNEHELTAHEQAATDGIADGVAVLMGANEGQAGAAGTYPPGLPALPDGHFATDGDSSAVVAARDVI